MHSYIHTKSDTNIQTANVHTYKFADIPKIQEGRERASREIKQERLEGGQKEGQRQAALSGRRLSCKQA